MTPTLRLTDTNAASDSSGRTWGLDGNLVWWLVGGLGAGITCFFLGLVALGASLMASAITGATPVLLVSLYIFGFRQGKPPGFDRDLLDLLLHGSGFGPALDAPPLLPLSLSSPSSPTPQLPEPPQSSHV